MVFGLKEPNKDVNSEKNDMSFINGLLQAVKEVNKPTSLTYFKLG